MPKRINTAGRTDDMLVSDDVLVDDSTGVLPGTQSYASALISWYKHSLEQ